MRTTMTHNELLHTNKSRTIERDVRSIFKEKKEVTCFFDLVESAGNILHHGPHFVLHFGKRLADVPLHFVSIHDLDQRAHGGGLVHLALLVGHVHRGVLLLARGSPG